MKLYLKPYAKVTLSLLLFMLILQLTGCTTAWTGQASQIITLVVPAIESLLGILSLVGVGISPDVLTQVNNYSQQAINALNNVVKPLIDQYSAAAAAAQPGILNEINAGLTTALSNLTQILTTLHITDPATQAKVQAIGQAVLSEVQALVNLVPALKGQVSDHAEFKKLVAAVKTPDEFKGEFNNLVAEFGEQYKIGN